MSQTAQVTITQYSRGSFSVIQDHVIRETMASLLVNDALATSFICSWLHIEYLAIGYLFCEGWIGSLDEILHLEVIDGEAEIRAYIPKNRFQNKNRSTYLTSGCGYRMQSFHFSAPVPRHQYPFMVSPDVIVDHMKRFQQASSLFQSTGGVHSVALLLPGQAGTLEEDIGRHNALDKAIGFGLKHQVPFEKSMIATSGRLSSDMVQKVASVPIPVIISKSAPTDAAIELANQIGITLIGFARGERFSIYTHPERVQSLS